MDSLLVASNGRNLVNHDICKIYSKSPFLGRKLVKITRNSHPSPTFGRRKSQTDNLPRSLFRNVNEMCYRPEDKLMNSKRDSSLIRAQAWQQDRHGNSAAEGPFLARQSAIAL
jgi:hypothetical protein